MTTLKTGCSLHEYLEDRVFPASVDVGGSEEPAERLEAVAGADVAQHAQQFLVAVVLLDDDRAM